MNPVNPVCLVGKCCMMLLERAIYKLFHLMARVEKKLVWINPEPKIQKCVRYSSSPLAGSNHHTLLCMEILSSELGQTEKGKNTDHSREGRQPTVAIYLS